jgi:UDP-glucose 4-epimerase
MLGRNHNLFLWGATKLEVPVKILVTGGAGFIASHIVDAYVAAGHEVVVLDNLSTGKRENVNPKARLVVMDILDDGLNAFLEKEKPEVVNHHAAQINVKVSLDDPAKDVRTNIEGTIRLLDACRRHSVRRFVFASSGGAMYGEVPEAPASENTAAKALSVYGVDKYSAELYAAVFSRTFGLEYVALRYANVCGPRQDPFGEGGVVSIFTEGMLQGRDLTIFGDGETVRDFVYVKDIAAANIAALSGPAGEAFNIGTGKATTLNGLYRTLAGITGYAKPPRYGPERLGDIRRSLLDSAKAERLLGWKPRYDLASGLKETVEFFKKIG